MYHVISIHLYIHTHGSFSLLEASDFRGVTAWLLGVSAGIEGTKTWDLKLEMEIGNGNESKKRTNHCCNLFFIVCLVITLVLCLAMVIGLAF